MRCSSSLEPVRNMVSVATKNGGSEFMQESEKTCNSGAEQSTGSVSLNSEPKEEQHEEEDDVEEGVGDDEDGSQHSSEFSGLEPDPKRSKACLGTVEDDEEEINSRLEILQTLVPGGYGMDTVSLLEQTACYIKLLGGVVNEAKSRS